MEETISTTVETSELQTTPELQVDTQPVEEQTTEVAKQEPENTEAEATESVEGSDAPKEPEKNWEQIAKDNQASFTRVSMELAELKKQMADSLLSGHVILPYTYPRPFVLLSL